MQRQGGAALAVGHAYLLHHEPAIPQKKIVVVFAATANAVLAASALIVSPLAGNVFKLVPVWLMTVISMPGLEIGRTTLSAAVATVATKQFIAVRGVAEPWPPPA
jgi:hypothetical protein